MGWTLPGATLRPVINVSTGVRRPTRGLILHVQVGTGSLFNMFNNRSSQASSTWWVSRTGVIEQYNPDPDNWRSWAQAAGNVDYHSVETEGFPSDPLTPAQIAAVAHIYAEGRRRWGWPLQLADTVGASGLGTHYMGGAAWGGHTCPDPKDGAGPRSRQRAAIIAAASALLTPTAKEPDIMASLDDLHAVIAPVAMDVHNIKAYLWAGGPDVTNTIGTPDSILGRILHLEAASVATQALVAADKGLSPDQLAAIVSAAVDKALSDAIAKGDAARSAAASDAH